MGIKFAYSKKFLHVLCDLKPSYVSCVSKACALKYRYENVINERVLYIYGTTSGVVGPSPRPVATLTVLRIHSLQACALTQ